MGKKSFWLIFFFSLVIRLIGANQSFWLDEGSSLVFARLPLSTLFTAVQNDLHPPLYYLLLHFWLPLAGHSEVILRLPGIIFGSLTVSFLFLFLQKILGKNKFHLAFLAAVLLSLNPLHIYYSQELRMYSLNVLLSLLSWYCLHSAVTEKKNDRSFWFYYSLFTLLNLYTFYGAFVNLLSQWLYLLVWHRSRLKPFLLANLAAGILFLPWWPSFSKQLASAGLLMGNLSFRSLALIMAKFTFGRLSLANKNAYAVFVAGISLYFILCSLLSLRQKAARPFLIWFYGSLAAAVVASLWVPVLGYWRLVFLLPAFVSLLVLGLDLLPAGAFYFNLAVIFFVFILGNLIFWNSPSLHREDWRAAAQLISRDNSLSIVNFPDVFAPLKFYAPTAYFYPDQISLGNMRPDLDQSLPLVLKDKETVFAFDYLSDLSDKKRSILTWLTRAGFYLVKIHNINGVGFIYEYAIP